MDLKEIFKRIALAAVFVFVLSAAGSLEVSATPVEGYTVPGQESLQEITEEQEETIVIGGEEEETIYSIPANKVAIEYSGKIDATTGEAAIGNAVNIGEDYYILESGKLAYNVKRSQFHILCGTRGFYCDAPSDAALSYGESFRIVPDEGVTVEVSFNGAPIEDVTQTEFSASGEYLLFITNHAERKEGSARITILEKTENDFKEYRLPSGFEYAEVLLDGVKKSIPYKNYYDFLEEGHYQLRWENSRIKQSIITEFTLDLTAPDLALPEVKNGVAAGQISFSDLEEGEYIFWERNSEEEGQIESPSEVLTKKGYYTLRVYDEAGNYSEYAFTLEGHFDINAILAIAIVLALIGGGYCYCRRLRTHMRVG